MTLNNHKQTLVSKIMWKYIQVCQKNSSDFTIYRNIWQVLICSISKLHCSKIFFLLSLTPAGLFSGKLLSSLVLLRTADRTSFLLNSIHYIPYWKHYYQNKGISRELPGLSRFWVILANLYKNVWLKKSKILLS